MTDEHTKWLQQRLRETSGELVQANDRIEQLEAALRWIADIEPEYEYHGTLNAQVVRILETARAALAPEQDK
jgi:hypothetical protein